MNNNMKYYSPKPPAIIFRSLNWQHVILVTTLGCQKEIRILVRTTLWPQWYLNRVTEEERECDNNNEIKVYFSF